MDSRTNMQSYLHTNFAIALLPSTITNIHCYQHAAEVIQHAYFTAIAHN